MKPKKLSNTFAVSGQIGVDDIAALAAQGFRSIICNRPDGESAGQPSFAQIEVAAKGAGLAAAYVPAVPGQMGQATVQAFAEALQKLPEPTLAYCRSGARSSMLWTSCRGGRG